MDKDKAARVIDTGLAMGEAAAALAKHDAFPAAVVGVVTDGPYKGCPVVTWSPLLARESVPAILRAAADQMERMNAAKNN